MNKIKGINVHDLDQLVKEKQPNLRVIDVRGMDEIAEGTVQGALAIPLNILPMRLREFSRDEKLVFICRSGARSAQACLLFQQQGYDNVHNLLGGMLEWIKCGLKVSALE